MLTYFPIGYIHYIAFTLYVLMAVYILKNGLTSKINISAAGIVVCFAFWSLGLAIKHNPLISQQAAYNAERIGSFGWIIFPFFTLWFFLEISLRKKLLKLPFLLPSLLLPGLFFYTAELLDLLQKAPVYSEYGWYSPWAESKLPLFFQIYYLSYLVTGLALLLEHADKNKSKIKKKQALVIFWGTIAAIFAGTFSEFISPKLFNFYGVFTELSDLYVIIWAGSITYAVTKLSVFKPNPENLAQRIVATMNESLVILDDSYNITYVNSSASKLLGIPEGSKTTHNFISVFPYIDAGSAFFDNFDKISGSNTIKTFAINSLGKKIPVSVSITLIRKINETLGAVCLIEDKSESIFFEEMLRKERDLAKKYIDIAGVMLVALNKKGQITLINKKGCEILGYFDREQLIGKNWFDDFVPPDCAPVARDIFDRLSRNTIIEGYVENCIVRKDGVHRLIKWSNALIFDEAGMFAGTISSGEDITEEKASREEMAKLVTSVEQIPSMIVITDLQGDITYVNPKFTDITGYSRKEIMGKNPRIFSSGETKKERYKELWDTISSGSQWKGELKNKKKDGTLYWESLSISPVMDYKKKIFAYVAVKEDITEKRRQQEMLVQSYEKLKELDTLKTNFTSMVSHELRTPLTSIKGFVSFLLGGVGGKLSPEQKDFVLTIKKNSERLLSLINDLLDLSKMESGTFSINKKTADIVPIIASSVKDISSIAEKKSIAIKINSPFSSLNAKLDEYRMSQVLINLLNNSIKFSPPGSQIEIEIRESDKNSIKIPDYEDASALTSEKYLSIRVIDHGPGLTKDNARRIFDRFYQVEDINTRKAQGTGLGLSIVENIVKLHDGIVWADSDGPGMGSVFSLIIPL